MIKIKITHEALEAIIKSTERSIQDDAEKRLARLYLSKCRRKNHAVLTVEEASMVNIQNLMLPGETISDTIIRTQATKQ